VPRRTAHRHATAIARDRNHYTDPMPSSRPAFPPRGTAVMPSTAVPIARAIGDSAPLTRLVERLRQSRRRFEDLRPALPAALQAQVGPGPIDDQSWTLLAANPAVAAKLRQLLPDLARRLQDAGWPPLEIRVRVLRP
jgi:hypothetical protein